MNHTRFEKTWPLEYKKDIQNQEKHDPEGIITETVQKADTIVSAVREEPLPQAPTLHIQDRLDHGLEACVQTYIDTCIERITCAIPDIENPSIDDLRDIINEADSDFDECLVCDLSIEEKLSAIEHHCEEEESIDINDLRSTIHTYSTRVVCSLGRQHMEELITDLQSFLDDEDLDLNQLIPANPHQWFRHHSETYPEANTTIYHYRNLENEGIHEDVYEYNLGSTVTLYFQKIIHDDEVSEEERTFDAN